MKTYPDGVLQNLSAPGVPVAVLRPVAEQNWRMFAPLIDAQAGLSMIQSAVPGAQMKNATEGQYSHFVYVEKDPDIRVRIAYGKVGELAIEEFPSDIFDRSQVPQPFIDSYSPGQPHVLKVRAVTPEIGELYWTAA